MNITQEQRNIIKSEKQEKISDLSLLHKYFLIEGATGIGKARALMLCIIKCNSKLKWIIVVPEIQQIENFKKEIIKFRFEEVLKDKIENIICYASLKNYENSNYNMAYNEAHSLSEGRLETALTITSEQVIFDSATISYDVRQRLNQIGDIFTYSLSLKEAIALGILPTPKIYIIDVNINSITEKFEYTKFKKVYKNVSVVDYYNYLGEQIKYWRDRYNREHQGYMENQSLQFASKRKRFIGSLKTIVAKQIIEKFEKENKRYICFSTNIAQSTELGGGLKYTVDSKKSSKTNTTIIENFNSLKTNKIFCVGQLISGMNLEQINSGLVVQLDSGATSEQDEINGTKITQIIGRILRSDEPEIYILHMVGTKDSDYLKNAIKAIGEEFIIKN